MNKNKFIYQEKFQYLTKAMLNVTDDCNLTCRYCFVEQNPHYMTLQTAKDVADWLYQNSLKRKELNCPEKEIKCSIYFFGGEPTLCYDSIIVPTVKYCQEKYPNIFYFGMTTNGTLLNEEKINFLKENKFSLLLSIDGAEETQCYNRPCKDKKQNSFKLVEKNIPLLLKNFPNLCFRSTIYAPTVNHLFENYLYAESLGFKHYEIIEDCRHDWTNEQLEILKNELSKIYCYRLTQIINHQIPMKVERFNIWLNYTINLYNNNNYFNIEKNNSVIRCGLATTTGSIGWDGSIYGCQEQTSKMEKSIFQIGNIYTGGIDVEKHTDLLTIYYNNQIEEKQKFDKCINCELNQLCKVNTLICPSTTWDLFKNMNSITEISCYIRKLYFYNSLITFKILSLFQEDNLIQNFLINKIKKQGGMIPNARR